MEEKRLSEKEVSDRIGNVIDDVVQAIKKASKDVFNLMVETTAETASDLIDKKVGCLKQKIKEKEKNEETN
jgi:hypothetical protein